MDLEVIILAAGKGKRMHSNLPKVLHKVANKPMLQHVIETAYELKPKSINVVVGHMSEAVEGMIATLPENLKNIINVSLQQEQLGTAHAVSCAMPKIDNDSKVLVLYGDTPLTPVDLLENFIDKLQDKSLCVLSAITDNPTGYGRIVRNGEALKEIVEEKDANAEQKAIKEINTGIIVAKASALNIYLQKIKNNNAQGEYYLTDLAGLIAKDDAKAVGLVIAPDFEILSGVNSKVQLAQVERLYQKRVANTLLEQGVTLADPNRIDVRGTLNCKNDVFIDINCIFEGEVSLGNNVVIGAGCVIKNSSIDDGSVISPYSVIEDSQIKQKVTIGPFARLRPGNVLEDEVHVGNFVECKKAHLGFGTKAGHLSYLGDAQIGKDVNIGAGTITCNYDGANKFKTVIGDDVFVGSDSQLVAPVTVNNGVTIAAGSTITKHTKMTDGSLVLTRASEVVVNNYQRPRKNK